MSSVAPGWYSDPDDPAQIRWWDGEAWTGNTQPNPAAMPLEASVVPPPMPAPTSSTPDPAPVPARAASAPVPPPFADSAPDLTVPPSADALPSRRDARDSGLPSIPVSSPVRLVPPTSTSFPISEPVRLVPPTAPVAEPVTESAAESAASGWSNSDAAPPTHDRNSFAVTPLATVSPAPASATTPWTSSSSFAQPAGSVDLASVDYEPMVRSWGGPRGGTSNRAVTGVATAGAWMLALSPVLVLGLLALGWALTESGTSRSTGVVAGSFAFVLIIYIVLAVIADFRRLGALGHEYRPSVLWVLMSPLMYLIARAIHVRRTTGRGTAPTLVYIMLSVVVGAAIGAASLALPREASTSELRQVETSIVTSMQQQGLDYSVVCPDRATLEIGSTFVCTAYDEVGPVALLRVSYGGVPGSFTFTVESSSAGS